MTCEAKLVAFDFESSDVSFLSPKKSRYSDVSTVQRRIKKTLASRVIPTGPCCSFNLSMCTWTVVRKSDSRHEQYAFRLLQEFVIGIAAMQEAGSYQSQQSIGSGRTTVVTCSNQRRFQLVRLDGSHRDIERRGNLLCRV